MEEKKKILIIEDHPLFRVGLTTIIGTDSRFEVVGEAGTGADGITLAEQLKPDLVLVDLSLPDKSGIQVIRELRVFLPEVHIMVVSMHSTIDHIAEAFQAGAAGYVVKESAAQKLLQGLEAVSRGDFFLDSSLSSTVVKKLIELPHRKATVTDDA